MPGHFILNFVPGPLQVVVWVAVLTRYARDQPALVPSTVVTGEESIYRAPRQLRYPGTHQLRRVSKV